MCYCEKTFECKNKFLKGVGHNDDELYDFKKNRKNELSGCCVQILLVSSKDIIFIVFISPGKLKLFGGFCFLLQGVEWIRTVFLGPLSEKES